MIGTGQHRLADFAASYPKAGISDEARFVARASLLDSLACAIVGRHEPVIDKVEVYAYLLRDRGGRRSWLTGQRFKPEAAALLNGTAAHALDFDDVTPAWRGHPGAVLWPALCASCDDPQTPLDLLADAYVVGFEIGAQLGQTLVDEHYAAGWHATATIGVIAATVACCRLRGYDARRTSNAIGLAVAQSAGTQANFGSMAKPLQAGLAASAAVRASALAAAGIEAADVLEGPAGFGSLYAGKDVKLSTRLPDSGGDLALLKQGIEVKHFPSCYAMHRAVEAALTIGEKLADIGSRVVAIDIEGTVHAHTPLLKRIPHTVDESRFSAEFGVACALTDGYVGLSSFAEGQLARPELVRLMSLCTLRENEALGRRRSARVTAHLANGEALHSQVTDLPGRSGDAPFRQRLQDKLISCLATEKLEARALPLWDNALAADAASPEDWPALVSIWEAGGVSQPGGAW